jgi:hypothetical protein
MFMPPFWWYVQPKWSTAMTSFNDVINDSSAPKRQGDDRGKTDTNKRYFHKVVSLLHPLKDVLLASIFPVRELKRVWMMIFM